jgi:ABC-type transporter Mla MlaB component
MGIKKIDDPAIYLLSIDGKASVGEVDELATGLRSALKSDAPTIHLDLENVTEIDVSFLQLLLSFELSLAAEARSLAIRSLLPGHVVIETANLLGIDLSRYFLKETVAR